MPDRYLTDLQIAERFGVHRVTPWRWAKIDPNFPKPVKLTPGCTRWRLADIETWERSRTVAAQREAPPLGRGRGILSGKSRITPPVPRRKPKD